MTGFLRRLRGIIGTGLTWAVGWAGLYGVFLLVAAAFGAEAQWELSPVLRMVFKFAVFGFVGGSSFAGILSIVERHKKLEDLSLWRIAMWGGVGGLALVALKGLPYLTPVIAFTVLGVGSATGTLALARRGSEPKLIAGEDEPVPALEGE